MFWNISVGKVIAHLHSLAFWPLTHGGALPLSPSLGVLSISPHHCKKKRPLACLPCDILIPSEVFLTGHLHIPRTGVVETAMFSWLLHFLHRASYPSLGLAWILPHYVAVCSLNWVSPYHLFEYLPRLRRPAFSHPCYSMLLLLAFSDPLWGLTFLSSKLIF